MKRLHLTLLALILILTACSSTTAVSPSESDISDSDHGVAPIPGTQTQLSTPTSLPDPTTTPSPTSTSMLPTAIPTLIPPTNAPIENHTSGLWQNSDAPIEVDHSLCNNSTYIDDVNIPDGTVFAPGESFVKTWTLENTGFCMWKDGTMLKFFEGNSMSGQDSEIGKTIASGRQAKISIELTAPSEEGTYTGYWILADEFGTPFGMPFFVQIVVSNE